MCLKSPSSARKTFVYLISAGIYLLFILSGAFPNCFMLDLCADLFGEIYVCISIYFLHLTHCILF